MGKQVILIIDDSPQNIQVAGSILTQYNYDILTATSGKQGISIAVKKKPT